jgi:hypothetical protein
MRAWILMSLLVSVALAGCAGDAPSTGGDDVSSTVDRDSFQLQAGRGAVAGLLVDDRFRPIHLVDNPQGEFQTTGFVLLQETGEQVKTNENGEFTFVNLEPGTYTLRVTAAGHEAVPQRTTITEGVFNELSVIARRVVSDAGFILSLEFAAFSSCGINLLVIGTPADCTGDLSGDTERSAFTVDYTDLDVTHMVQEMRANNPNYFDVWMRPLGQQSVGQAYQIMGGPDTTYLRFQLNLNESATHSAGASGTGREGRVWDNQHPVQTVMYLNSLGFEETGGATFGAGVYFGVQANFVQSAFLGNPQVDVDSFCVYCV